MKYECSVCGYVYDSDVEGCPWNELAGDWECPVCGADTSYFTPLQPAAGAPTAVPQAAASGTSGGPTLDGYLAEWRRASDELKQSLAVIQHMAITGRSTIEPMRSRKPVVSWDEILVMGAQLATLPRNEDEPVSTQTVIGPKAAHPLIIDTPVFVSPAHFNDITTPEELRAKVRWLREASGGKPIGIKLAAGHIEADLEVALAAAPDFITIDGRPGATGAAAKVVKDATAVPTIFALARARRFLDRHDASGVSLVVTGGLRVSSDFVKALAMGADAVAIASAALIAIGCQQYRICDTGRCPVGITTQDPELRSRLDIDLSAERLANFLRTVTGEIEDFVRLTGHDDVHQLSVSDLRTTCAEIAQFTTIAHVGEARN